MVLVVAMSLQCTIEVGDGGCSGSRYKVQGSGHLAREERQVRGISGVNLATIGTLYIEVGDKEQFHIEADDNLLEYFETDVKAGELVIETRPNTNLRPKEPVKYYLTVKDLESIKVSSCGDIEGPDIEADRFSIAIYSSGSVEVGDVDARALDVRISSCGNVLVDDVDVKSLDVDINSSGNFRAASGSVVDQDVRISSSGNYHGRAIKSERARVRVSSSGSAHVHVTDELDVVISSSGSVYYVGNPSVRQSISSSGRVKHVGL